MGLPGQMGPAQAFPSWIGFRDQGVLGGLKCPASSSSGMCWQEAGPCLQEQVPPGLQCVPKNPSVLFSVTRKVGPYPYTCLILFASLGFAAT